MLDEFSIVTAFDVNFIELAAVFFLSLSARGVNLGNLQGIYAMVSGLSQAERDMLNKLAPMDIVFIDVSELLERELPSVYTNHIPLMSYARLFMLDLVPVEHRILYIDPDTIVLGSLSGLAKLDLEGRPVGAAETGGSWARRKVAELGLPDDWRYLNAGVLAIDPPAWRAARISERAIGFAINHGNLPWNHDQDALMLALDDNWRTIHRRWNMRPGDYRFLTRRANDVRIAHFTLTKPTHADCKHPARGEFLRLRQGTPFRDRPLIEGKAKAFQKRWRAFWRLVNRGMREIVYRLSAGVIFGDKGIV
jgi:lipopolysaccharide biosynthesis glycosyltransferase